jgi:hypothetical protein
MPKRTRPHASIFTHTDPLQPPQDDGELGRLAKIVAYSSTWFFADPTTDVNRGPVETLPRHADEVIEAVEVAHAMLRDVGLQVKVAGPRGELTGDGRGFRLVDLFCDLHIRRGGSYSRNLASGRVINQRQLLAAMALYQSEQAARAVAAGETRTLCDLMEDLLELVCEIRRALDREAGSSLAARRARQRLEKYDRIRANAIELCSRQSWQSWKSARKASQKLFPEVQKYSVTLGCPLSLDSGEETLYRWLRLYKNSVSA